MSRLARHTSLRRGFIPAVVVSALLACSCEAFYPEVIVINEIGEAVLVRNISFNGCLWDEVIEFEEATSPGRCLSGADRVHFSRIDATSYCRDQVDDGTIPELCFCDPEDEPDDDPMDPGLVNETPQWFNYQTITEYRAETGDLLILRLVLDDMEQDFSVPGPYGH